MLDSRVDTVSEWLRRWTRNPLGSARRGSNPLGVGVSLFAELGWQSSGLVSSARTHLRRSLVG